MTALLPPASPSRTDRRSTPVRVALVLGSVLGPVLLGVATVLVLAPLDPPDLGWGHVASHLLPAAVVAGIVVCGRAAWPPARGRRSTRVRAVLVASMVGLALAQLAEAVVAAAGRHDGTAHTVLMVVANLVALVVVASVATTACLAAGSALRRARRRSSGPVRDVRREGAAPA